ncbi:class F sortase [Nonomuraea sp. NPDC050556]|uniref:class F sortase n=1 Tax=Nonomuraea sp. NPDC050556 TaxID=3364369 RepID=UPI0037AAE624
MRVRRVVAFLVVAGVVAFAFDRVVNRGYAPPPVPLAGVSLPPGGYGEALRRSVPQRVEIPAIGVDASVVRVGRGRDGAIEVPPLDRPELTGWFTGGVTPGEPGAAVLFGHVDSRVSGPAVFYRLGDLRPGDGVVVTRSDGSSASFVVDHVASYAKADFPTRRVYGPAGGPELRLVTCGGPYDPDVGYLDNVIAFAHLPKP